MRIAAASVYRLLATLRRSVQPVARLLTLIASTVCLAAGPDPVAVLDVHCSVDGGLTRIAVSLDGPEYTYRQGRVPDPERLFVDLSPARLKLPAGASRGIPLRGGAALRVRLADTSPGTVRLVVDLGAPAESRIIQLDHPYRLIVEIRERPEKATPIGPAPESGAGAVPAKTSGPAKTPEVATVPPAQPAPAVLPTAPRPTRPEPAAAPAAPSPKPERAEVTLPPRPVPNKPVVSIPRTPVAAADLQLPPRPKPLATSAADPADSGETAPDPAAAPPMPPVSTPEPAAVEAEPSQQSAAPQAVASAPVETARLRALPAAPGPGSTTMTRALGLKIGRVVIDPGHGGHDLGTTGPAGLNEKDLVLDISTRLSALLNTRLGLETILTRTDDTFVALLDRTERANGAQADLFLSIHANSSRARGITGAETYYLSVTNSQDALEVAARENASSDKNAHELRSLLQKIVDQNKVGESKQFATQLQDALREMWRERDAGSRDRGVKKAPFLVLVGADMPAALVEIGFLSNARQERQLLDVGFRQRIAEALYSGILGYIKHLNPGFGPEAGVPAPH
jgi:N-acetylmuramoyl-L-alanine amidase